VKQTEKDRSTCLCKIHENLNFKINASYTAGMITTKDPNQLMKQMVCNLNKKESMYRECQVCAGKKMHTECAGGEIMWNEWQSKRVERKEEE